MSDDRSVPGYDDEEYAFMDEDPSDRGAGPGRIPTWGVLGQVGIFVLMALGGVYALVSAPSQQTWLEFRVAILLGAMLVFQGAFMLYYREPAAGHVYWPVVTPDRGARPIRNPTTLAMLGACFLAAGVYALYLLLAGA